MVYLDKNTTAFNSYFKWKKHIWFHNLKAEYCTICSMCIKLQLEEIYGIEKKIITNMNEYWNKNQCRPTILKHVNNSAVFEFS